MCRQLLAIATAIAMVSQVMAAERTVTLSLPTMDCPVCPITVKRALNKVDGVDKAVVDFDRRQATVTFNDAKTNADQLIKATTNAGYPSTVLK
jgi:periplasmic mercuric ion binding protein